MPLATMFCRALPGTAVLAKGDARWRMPEATNRAPSANPTVALMTAACSSSASITQTGAMATGAPARIAATTDPVPPPPDLLRKQH